MKKAVFFFSFAAILLFAVFAEAGSSAQKTIQQQDNCQSYRCLSPKAARRTLTAAEISQLPAETRSKLQAKAVELAQIWGDTILEGDYWAADETQLDAVEVLSWNGQFFGYRITYSSVAWDTSNCAFNSRNLESLRSCPQGRIVESGFISPDFQEIFRDRYGLANFETGL